MKLLFMVQDEDIYTFFEPELPAGPTATSRAKIISPVNRTAPRFTARSNLQPSLRKTSQHFSFPEKKASNGKGNRWSAIRDRMTVHEGSSVLDLQKENYFSCAVGRKRSSARYLLGSPADVVSLLKDLADSSPSN